MRYRGGSINIYDAIRILLPVRILSRWAHGSIPDWQCPICKFSCFGGDTFTAIALGHSRWCPARYQLGLLGWWSTRGWPFLRSRLAPIEISAMKRVHPKDGWVRIEHFSAVVDGLVVCEDTSDEVAHFKIVELAETRPVYYVRRAWMEQLRAAFQ